MGNKRKAAYVVTVGRAPGVFTTWEECKSAVSGFSGAKFMGYATMAEAQQVWAAHESAHASRRPDASRADASPIKRARADPPDARATPDARDARDAQAWGAPPPYQQEAHYQQDSPPPDFVRLPRGAAMSRGAATSATSETARPPPLPVDLSAEQLAVVSAALRGESLFFTGNAGAGKTTTLKAIIAALRQKGSVYVTASTGAAAVMCGGATLHSFAGVGLGQDPAGLLVAKLSGIAKKRWKDCSCLVIDEISMITAELFDKIEYVARAARSSSEPFGGLQLIVSGDFAQLPPVTRGSSPSFAFEAKSWGACLKREVVLKHIFRQKDISFVTILNELRIAQLSANTISALTAASGHDLSAFAADSGIEPTKLFARNANVDDMNEQRLHQLPGRVATFKASDRGVRADKLESCSFPTTLLLKPGAQVMHLHNTDVSGGLANGSRGIVLNFEKALTEKGKEVTGIRCRFLDGKEHVILHQKIEMLDGEQVVASRKQYPLKLAWALTIHKSQGQTIDLLEVDLAGCFEYGMAYVACSRATDLQRLRLLHFEPRLVKAHPKVVDFHKRLLGDEDDVVDLTDGLTDSDVVDLTQDPAAPPQAGDAGDDGARQDDPEAAAAAKSWEAWDFTTGKRRPPPQPRAAAVVSGSADCLKGCKFVVTGVLPTYERTDLEELIKRHGGAVTQAVSGKTTHLVAGSALDDGRPTCQSSKYQKASQNSIPILTEAGLLAMLA